MDHNLKLNLLYYINLCNIKITSYLHMIYLLGNAVLSVFLYLVFKFLVAILWNNGRLL